MPPAPLQSDRPHYLAAALSALVPGLGHALKRQLRQAVTLFTTSAILLACAWAIGRVGGTGADIFFLMLIVLPWWVIQSYDAYLPTTPGAPARTGFLGTLQTIWERAHDIRFLGFLFLLTALTDLYIILVNPSYALTIFCTKPSGVLGVLAKAQSPTLHTLIGYGFLRLRRWSLFLYFVYAAFGLLNATANYACLGYGRVRTVFLLTLIAFTIYVFWRRNCFKP